MCSEAISGQTARPIGIPTPDSARRVPDCELTPKFGTFFQSEGGLNWGMQKMAKNWGWIFAEVPLPGIWHIKFIK